MRRDPTKPEVPDNLSIKLVVDVRWKEINKHIYDDIPFSFELAEIEEVIAL